MITNPKIIFHDPIDTDDVVSVMEEENIDMVVDAKSVIRDLSIIEALNAAFSDEVEPQEKIFYRGIWRNSS